MEEIIKEQTGNQFAFSSLKIRTMQDDLKKPASQVDLPAAPEPSPELPPLIPEPKEKIRKVPEEVAEPQKNQFQKIISRILPEPPPYLPTEPAPAPPPQELPQQPEPMEPPTPGPSILQLESELIYKEPQKLEQPEQPPRRIKFALVFGISATVVILGIFGFIYYRFWAAPKPLCQEGQITAECRCGQQAEETKNTGFCCNNLWADFDCSLTKAPEPLIPSINQLLAINAQGTTLDQVISEIENAAQNISGEDTRIIALKLADSPPKYATLDDLIKIFGIVLPENLKTNNQAFNLIVYSKPSDYSSLIPISSSTPIASSSPIDLSALTASSTPEFLSTSTPEIRLVLILSQKNKSSLELAMSSWEPTMLDDMKPMILGEPAEPATTEFVSTVYHNGFFRYKNLPRKTTTINYTVYQNLVILGTSKNSIFYIYDSLNSNNTGTAN